MISLAMGGDRLAAGLAKLRRGQGIRYQMARGSLWLGAGNGLENALRIGRNMILTRLIAPEAFGAMALVLAVNGVFEALTEIGVREAVIQNPRGGSRAYLGAAWWVALVRGVALYACAWLIAPWAAAFYHDPALTPIMRVAFLGIVFNGAMSTRAYAALKRLRYRPWVMIYQGGALAGIAVAMALGVALRNAWALAIGFAVEAGARCLLSFVICPMWPGWHIDRKSLRSLLGYAGGMVGVPLLTLLYAKSDIFVVGKICSSAQLGFYTMAASLAYIPDTLCATVLAPVLMPALSTMQEDRERMRRGLLRALKVLALVFLPLLTLMGCGAPWLLRWVYGAPYAAASLAFTLLCANVGVRILGWGLVTTFFATGRPALSRNASALRLVVLVAVIVPLVLKMGAAGAALAGLLSGLAWAALCVVYLRRLLGLSFGNYFAALRAGLTASALIAGVWAGAEALLRL